MAVPYTFEQMVEIMQPLCFLRLFQTKSKKGEIKFVNMKVYQLATLVLFLEFFGVMVAIVQHFYMEGTSGIKPVLTIAVLMLVTISRGFFMRRNSQHIASILNQLDMIFPRSLELQQHYEIDAVMKRVRYRLRVFEIFAVFGLVGFNAKPLYHFVKVFRSKSPIKDDYYPIPSWYPFNLKHSYTGYPFILIVQCFATLSAALFTLNWNHVYSIIMTLICEHYKYMGKMFAEINAKDSNSVLTSQKLQERIHGLIKHLQLLDSLCIDINFAFVTPLIIMDAISVAAICLQVFIISHENIFSIYQHIVAVIVISWMIFETSWYGEMLEQASNDVGDGIYNHNWYEGSIEHRKLVLRLLQWRNEPRRLSWGKSSFNINLHLFTQIIYMAYELYSFLEYLK